MKEKVQTQIYEYMQDLEINDRLIEITENKRLNKAEIGKNIERLKNIIINIKNQEKKE